MHKMTEQEVREILPIDDRGRILFDEGSQLVWSPGDEDVALDGLHLNVEIVHALSWWINHMAVHR